LHACAQTRLPGELAAELEGIAGEYEADLVYYTADGEGDSDSEAEGVEPLRPLRNFPAVALISAIHGALEVPCPALQLLIWHVVQGALGVPCSALLRLLPLQVPPGAL
jgi:hypothetical protein